jgi:hypothetical protein
MVGGQFYNEGPSATGLVFSNHIEIDGCDRPRPPAGVYKIMKICNGTNELGAKQKSDPAAGAIRQGSQRCSESEHSCDSRPVIVGTGSWMAEMGLQKDLAGWFIAGQQGFDKGHWCTTIYRHLDLDGGSSTQLRHLSSGNTEAEELCRVWQFDTAARSRQPSGQGIGYYANGADAFGHSDRVIEISAIDEQHRALKLAGFRRSPQRR